MIVFFFCFQTPDLLEEILMNKKKSDDIIEHNLFGPVLYKKIGS